MFNTISHPQDIELNAQREIPYLHVPMHELLLFSLYLIKNYTVAKVSNSLWPMVWVHNLLYCTQKVLTYL